MFDPYQAAETANVILLTFGAVCIGLLVFTAWMGARYFFGFGYDEENYQSDQVRPNVRLRDPARLAPLLRKA